MWCVGGGIVAIASFAPRLDDEDAKDQDMMTQTRLSPAEIRERRQQHPEMRERDFARIQGVSEAELVAAYVGEGVVRLRADVTELLNGLPALGEVMALTRNESAVHEKIGPYEEISVGPHNALVLGEQIDLRIFPSKWTHVLAVEKTNKEGVLTRSLQIFNAAGEAVHKVHLRPATNLDAYAALIERLRAPDQIQTIELGAVQDSETPAGPAADHAELKDRWSKLTDTHQFFFMLKKVNMTRHQAVSLIGGDYAHQLDPGATRALLEGAAGTPLPIMVFVGNSGCIQIHSGPIQNVAPMGPWINVMDETFHMHLRLDHLAEVWAVRKPTKDGHVTSIECFGADKKMIVQFFGKRHEGMDERPEWRALAEGLPRLNQSNAA
jgi:putative hemin transport protein